MRGEFQECYMNCKQCSRYPTKNSKETLITRPVPEYIFQRIGLDTMTLDGRKYLVGMDYFSNYSMVDRLQGISSDCTLKSTRKRFMRHSIPEEVVSDGGPEFDDQMMRELAHKYGFKWRYTIELENGKRLVRNKRQLRLITRPKHSNMAEINRKQDITANGSEENTKQQQPDMTERQWRLKRVTACKTPNRYGEMFILCMYGGC